jgi:hypothetical protein
MLIDQFRKRLMLRTTSSRAVTCHVDILNQILLHKAVLTPMYEPNSGTAEGK